MSSKSIRDSIEEAKAAAGELTGKAASELFCDRPTAADDMDDLPPLRTREVAFQNITTWLDATPGGLTISKDTTLFERLTFRVNMADMWPCKRIAYGNPVRYRQDYDDRYDVHGTTWYYSTLPRVRQVYPQAEPYDSADIVLTALCDVRSDNGIVLVSTGQTIGARLPPQGLKAWYALHGDLQKAGLPTEWGTCTVAITHLRGVCPSLRFELVPGPEEPAGPALRAKEP